MKKNTGKEFVYPDYKQKLMTIPIEESQEVILVKLDFDNDYLIDDLRKDENNINLELFEISLKDILSQNLYSIFILKVPVDNEKGYDLIFLGKNENTINDELPDELLIDNSFYIYENKIGRTQEGIEVADIREKSAYVYYEYKISEEKRVYINYIGL